MSTVDLGGCNYCQFKHIEEEAEKKGKIITKESGHVTGGPGGTDVYVHFLHEELSRTKHFAGWFDSIPEHCTCGEN